MNPLSTSEKEIHHKKMEGFVERINRCVMPVDLLHKVRLGNVAYGVKVDDAYFYFDFPYNANADALNEDLQNNKLIQGIDVRLHSAFFEYFKHNGNGYIGYIYNYDKVQNLFCISQSLTNLTLAKGDMMAYLPIVHSAITTEGNFLAPTEIGNCIGNLKKVLVLCRWPHAANFVNNDGDEPIYQPNSDNILVTTFIIDSDDIIIDQQLVDQLHEDVLYFIDSYFTSPVVEKIIAERRKSEVLAYHHSIDNLS